MDAKVEKPSIGVSTAFTGKYQASKVIIRFVELLDVSLIKSNVTKPAMIEAGTTLASADFCLPLRVYIGHIYNLINEHPKLDYLLAPIIKGEHPSSSTCAKYRDLDGVIIRSLNSMTGYRLASNIEKVLHELTDLVGEAATQKILNKTTSFPKIIAPEIESLDKNHLRQVCIKVYSEIFQLNSYKRFFLLTKADLLNSSDEELRKIGEAFEQAYHEIIEIDGYKYIEKLKDANKLRLGLLGRSYLVDDGVLSANIKTYFNKKGVSVITIQDVPFSVLKEKYEVVNGFYDYHRLGQAFIDTLIDEVDGFITIGSFGCHPDAFQMEYFAKYINERGKSCWNFKFDEQTGNTGFQTRFETILGFLEKNRDIRIGKSNVNPVLVNQQTEFLKNKPKPIKPVFIWPNMGVGIDLILKETWHQLGLNEFLYPPKAVNEETIVKGDYEYTEACSPFVLYLGSLRDTIERLIIDLEQEADGKQVEPRRIIILMAGGKGPCTFGWYAIAGQKTLIDEYQSQLDKFGHTIEMIAIDNQGRNLLSFLQELADVANNNNLLKVIQLIKIIENPKESKYKKTKAELYLIKLLKNIVWPGWKKLFAFEEIQNKALIVRAHELVRGSTTRKLKELINQLDLAHTLVEIEDVKSKAIRDLEKIEGDNIIRPKVVIVGEIYVSLTSFANRGTVDNLLGSLGIEAIEGMRLSHFILGAFKGLKYSFLHNQPFMKSIFDKLEAKGLYSKDGWVREPSAKPFLEHEIGGDGQPTIARARHHIEKDGVDGILHIYPFKCMPEGIAKDALIEMSLLYGIKSLHLSFSKETDIERLKTELGTFATLLHDDLEKKKDQAGYYEKEMHRREKIGMTMDKMYHHNKQLQSIKIPLNISQKLAKNIMQIKE